jgi:predicted membrane channel-forming protein YqfA (hemolysin III family)
MKDYIAKESLLEESKQQYFLMGAVAYYLVSHLYHSFSPVSSSSSIDLRSSYLANPSLRTSHPSTRP